MGNVIFCKTRHQDTVTSIDPDGTKHYGYGSYLDLWHMVEWNKYPLIYVDEIDPQSDNTYIFSPANAETMNGWPNAKAQIILWQLEWMLTDEHNTPPGVKRTWSMDKWMAESRGFEYVPIGGDERLNELGTKYYPQKRYDVAIMSYQTHRRQVITAQLENAGLSLAPLNNLWGRKRSDVLLSSWCMCHTHQVDNAPGIAGLRWCLAAAHNLPMISEQVNDRGIFTPSHMVQAEYKYLAAFTANMLKDKRMLADYGMALNGLLCRDYTFERSVNSHV